MEWTDLIGYTWLALSFAMLGRGLLKDDSDYIAGGAVILLIISIIVWVN